MLKEFSYITPMGSTVDDIILSGKVEVADDATPEEIEKACYNEAIRILREKPEWVMQGLKLC